MQNFRKEIYKWKRNINRLSGTTWSVTYIKEWLFSSHKYRYFYNKGRYFYEFYKFGYNADLMLVGRWLSNPVTVGVTIYPLHHVLRTLSMSKQTILQSQRKKPT